MQDKIQVISARDDYEVIIESYDSPETRLALIHRIINSPGFPFDVLGKLLQDSTFVDRLKSYGYHKIELLEKEGKAAINNYQKAIHEKSYYIGEKYYNGYSGMSPVNLQKLKSHELNGLASGKKSLFVMVDNETIQKVSPSKYKDLLKAKKDLQEREAQKLLNAEERKKKKLEKEIEAAKKLLKEHGEQNEH